MWAPGWSRSQPGTVPRVSFPGAHLVSWLSLHVGFFLLSLGETVPMERPELSLPEVAKEEADGKGRVI